MTDWSLFKFFLPYFRPQRARVVAAIASMPFSIAGSVLFPWLIIIIFDQFIIPQKWQGLPVYVGMSALVLLISGLADAVYVNSLQKAGFEALTSLRRDLFDHVLHLPRAYYDRHPIGVLLSRLTSDFEAINDTFAIGVLGLITDLLKIIVLLIFMMFISAKLTLVLLVVTPALYFAMKILKDKLRQASNEARTYLASATGYLQECLNGIRTVQLYNAESRVLKKYSAHTNDFYIAQKKSNNYDALLFSIIEGITFITIGIMLWAGAGLKDQGLLSIGVVIGFMNSLQKIFIPIREFTQQLTIIQRAMSALEHIHQLLMVSAEPRESAAQTIRHIETVEFDRVSFRYREEGPDVLDDISFKLERGQKMALVGATGSGKSTIVKLLSKAYGQYRGSIRINGIELSALSKDNINSLMAVMQQDVHLFNDTIAFNISLGRADLTTQDIRSAAGTVYANEFIESLDNGYDFRVSANGGNLSAGQAQLVSFARTIALRHELIILDEATSTVDSVTEQTLQRAITRLFEGRTVVAIAHRLSTIQHSDLILVLDKGRIVERGTHQELLQQCGVYNNLVQKMKEREAG